MQQMSEGWIRICLFSSKLNFTHKEVQTMQWVTSLWFPKWCGKNWGKDWTGRKSLTASPRPRWADFCFNLPVEWSQLREKERKSYQKVYILRQKFGLLTHPWIIIPKSEAEAEVWRWLQTRGNRRLSPRGAVRVWREYLRSDLSWEREREGKEEEIKRNNQSGGREEVELDGWMETP